MKQPTSKPKKINIWQYQFILTRRLAWWGVLSFVFGVVMFFIDDPFLKGFGIQAAAWGFIDTAIAIGATFLTTKRRAALSDPAAKDAVTLEAYKLRKLLKLMRPLDVIYIVVGLLLAFTWGRKSAWWFGTGWGVVVQGLFLLGFDWYHTRNIPGLKEGA